MRLLYKSGPMESLRKWFYKPKRDDRSLLAQFFFADDALNMVATELDSFDGRKDPERCSTLVNQLRHAQDRVLNITSQIMDQLLGDERVARGFRVKFPEDVLQDNLAGQLWFGAECLAAGSSIMNREEESAAMRPLARALTRSLETVRSLLREQCLRPRELALSQHDDMLQESLRIFDRLFAEFELCYVSAMVNVKTPHEFEAQQLICVLFSESLRRALKQNLLTQEQVDSYDPALMFAVPRLAIVSGLLIYSTGPLSIDNPPDEMSDMFRPFRTLLHKIRSLLWTLDRRELVTLERLLCTNEDLSSLASLDLPPESLSKNEDSYPYPDIGEFVSQFYADHAYCRDLYTQSSTEPTITEDDYLPDNVEVMTPIIDGLRRLNNDSDTETESNRNTIDTTSTDTFQTNDNVNDSKRKPSKAESSDISTDNHVEARRKSTRESSDLSSLRNLSTNGLMMFDPLVINAAASTSTENRPLPDNDLVTSLNEQVTEIADRLSSIATSDVEMDHNQKSYSTNDVPTLVTNDGETFGFNGPRNEQLTGMPSTSHGYLIPNAISQEPVVMSLSHNNSAIFNQDADNLDINNTIMNSDLPLIIPDNIDTQILNTNISIANANLSSLLLTNEELRQNYIEENAEDNTSFHSAKMVLDRDENEKVKFMLGYESDHESPVDSGVSTENTSLDRSPDTEQSKDIKDNHFMQQNRVLESPEEKDTKNTLESSFSEVNNEVVNINYVEPDTTKNEAGSSSIDVLNRISSDEEGSNEATNVKTRPRILTTADIEYMTIDEVLAELNRHKVIDKSIRALYEDNNVSSSTDVVPNSSHSNSRQKSRQAGSKSKKKKNKTWSPGMVLLDRSNHDQNSLRFDLDFFDEESTSYCTCDCTDDEQIAVALQAQELAARQQARRKFKSSEDLIHRLFVCIAGVADQLQTNFAADLRNILKSVFVMNQTPDDPEIPEPPAEEKSDKSPTIEYEVTEDQVIQNGSSFDSVYSAEEVYADSTSDSTPSESNSRLVRRNTVNATTLAAEQAADSRRKAVDNTSNLQASVSIGDLSYREERRTAQSTVGSNTGVSTGSSTDTGAGVERLPEWVPDIAAAACMRCQAHFTAFRRRHHCRNCGKVFCASCSSNSIPLPRYGQMKPVRVCEECYQSTTNNRPQASSQNR
ncbi:lateral signaling target protein 2 homolog [Achroia grisella]|uniref:lateral signaling target protein 2 homolog n=1 Tax=Achroia grisella TaxID=688607 RepID=UPI0027D2640E|nr:lateral signaling target protein 2 homolog [Achroia grisella]